MGYGDILKSISQESRNAVAEEWAGQMGILLTSNRLILGAIGSIISRVGQIDLIQPDLNKKMYRLSVDVGIIQGIGTVENCIAGGLYIQAAPLVRQEIEGVEAIREIISGLRLSGKSSRGRNTPQLRTMRHFGKLYGQLSEIAHFSKPELIGHLLGGMSLNIDPIFNSDFSKLLFGTHIFALTGVALDLANLFASDNCEILQQDEEEHIAASLGMLEAEGIFKIKTSG